MNNEEILTVKDILKRPLFSHAKLLAGKLGIDRKIEWIHIIDVTTAAPFTNKNNLILTTGIGFQKKENNRKKYMLELIDKGASGLCVELSEHLQEITADMIDTANQHQFPVIVFNKPIRFVDITQDVHALLINRKFQVLNELELFSHKVQKLTLESTDITATFRLLHDYTSHQIIYYSLFDKDQFFPLVSPAIADEIKDQFKTRIEQQNIDSDAPLIMEINKKRWILFQPVICLGQIMSYVGVILHKKAATESVYLNRLLDYVCKAVGHIILRKMYLIEKTTESQNALINDVLEKKITSEEQARARMGFHSQANGNYSFIAGLLDIKHILEKNRLVEIESKNQDIVVVLRSILKRFGLYSLLMLKNNQIYLLAAQESFSEASSIQNLKSSIRKSMKQLKKYTDQTLQNNVVLTAGFGQVKHRITDTYASFKEAFDTLDVARLLPTKIRPFYDELGIFQLLKGISDKKLLASFISNNLGAVMRYDKENNANLLETLDEYLKCMGAKQETAEKLYIHRQTLYHRLEKLEGLLGHDYLNPEKRMCLELALRAFEIGQQAT